MPGFLRWQCQDVRMIHFALRFILCDNSLCFSHQAGEHLYHTPDDAVWSWFAPHRPAAENIAASCSQWGQHVSGGTHHKCSSRLFVPRAICLRVKGCHIKIVHSAGTDIKCSIKYKHTLHSYMSNAHPPYVLGSGDSLTEGWKLFLSCICLAAQSHLIYNACTNC